MLPVLFGQQSTALLHQSDRAVPGRGGDTRGVYTVCRADAPTWPGLLWIVVLKDVGGVVWRSVQKSVRSCSPEFLFKSKHDITASYSSKSSTLLAPLVTPLTPMRPLAQFPNISHSQLHKISLLKTQTLTTLTFRFLGINHSFA